jgi:membrane-bound lytic murein transglycosylase A
MQPAHWGDLPDWGADNLLEAWPAFLQSCRALVNRQKGAYWQPACNEAKSLVAPTNARLKSFFENHFKPYLLTNPNATTTGTVTGYYEPLLLGSRTRTVNFAQPVLSAPADLPSVMRTRSAPKSKVQPQRRNSQSTKMVPYHPRAEIIKRAQSYADRVLLWVQDAVELFFLQIQGSGRVKLPDGKLVRIGYAGQNGYPFKPIGGILAKRGELKLEHTSMQHIQNWGRANPGKLDDILNANQSYVFFRELPNRGNDDEGPPGALGVPLTPERSIAIDPRNIPLGAPVFLATTYPSSSKPLRRLMLAQDTGGAIRGVVRADFFWGFGNEAGQKAEKMRQKAQMWVLLPPGYVAR